jgi:hypothetical protein
MNLTMRARHFWNRIINTNLYDMREDGNWDEQTVMMMVPDVNYNIFNLDAFFTWDFRLGSRLIFAWKNSLGPDYENFIPGDTNPSYFKNVGEVLRIPHGNEFTIRFIYFLDYQQFRKK